MYCKFCATKIKPIDTWTTGAFCSECSEVIENKDMSKIKPVVTKYIVKVPFYGQSRGYKIFHIDATSEATAVHKVKNFNDGDLISEEIDRDDRSEERQYAECYGVVHD